MTTTLTWLVRYGHVLGGAIWVGGYVVLTLLIVPVLRRDRSAGAVSDMLKVLASLAMALVRVLTYTGTATIFLGVILITRTRGFENVDFGSEWGVLIISSIVIAVLLLGMGDSALRPALGRLIETGEDSGVAQLAYLGLGLTIVAIGVMTRAVYASS